MSAVYQQLQGLYTAGDVLCAVDCVRALPDHRHVVFVNHDRSLDHNVLAELANLGAEVRREALVGPEDLDPDVCAVIYHCVGYDDQLRGAYVRFGAPPDGVDLLAWIHTPGTCGQTAERYGHLAGRPISRLLFDSSFSLHNTPGLQPWDYDRCAIVHPSVDTARFGAITREPDGRFRAGRWSRGADNKYSDDFLELLGGLGIDDAEYVCMGIPPKFRTAAPPPNVRMLENGAMPLDELLAQLDVLIFKTHEPSWHEGFCRTVTEAMAAGVIPVVENRGGIPDQVAHGHNGFLCDTNDDYGRFCRLLHDDPALRAQLSANARESAARVGGLERLRADLERLLSPATRDRLDLDGDVIATVDPYRPVLPFADEAFDEIEAYHVLEHVANKPRILEEVWRIARHNAVIRIKLPDRRHSDAFVDPTHFSYWEVDTVDFFVPGHRRTPISVAAFGVLRKFTTEREIYWELVALRHRPKLADRPQRDGARSAETQPPAARRARAPANVGARLGDERPRRLGHPTAPVRMTGDRPTIWQYWEGSMPPYVALCLETVRRHHPDARLLDRHAYDELRLTDAQGEHDLDAIDHPAVRADVVRAYLLHRFGGIWLDCDFVLLRPLDDLATLPSGVTFAAFRESGGAFTNALMLAMPSDPVVAELYRRIRAHLRDDLPVTWLELGASALNPAIEMHPAAVLEIEEDLVSPIPWQRAAQFDEPGDGRALDDGRRLGIMLWNASATDDRRQRSQEAVLRGDTLLGALLRHALAV